jgi:hypothetical protein
MSDYIDISTSLHTNSLTLFIGTGFSKYMTNGKAPSWLELLVEATERIDKGDKLINQLFNSDSSGKITEANYDLTICAQILENEYKKKRKDIKSQIAEIINERVNDNTVDKDRLKHLKVFFLAHPNINIITTNYDTIFSDFVLPLTSRIIIEGSTIPRINTGQNIYHIHGCVNRPDSIVLTIKDYYNFQNSNNYFSRKFFILLQENTVAVLGYSLGDFNLNSILSEVKNSKKESFRRTDIYYIPTDSVDELLEEFYAVTYGIKALQRTKINEFFDLIDSQYDSAKRLIDSVENLKGVMEGSKVYSSDFLKLKVSLTIILVQAGSIGIESTDENFVSTLFDILKKKKEFTTEDGAWLQYEHLADWLVEIASRIIVKGTKYEEEFCEMVTYSLEKSSRKLYIGYSWHAWTTWYNRWREMKVENQIMFEELIDTTTWPPHLEVPAIIK